ncbi:MAG: outer membrane lipoprotein-sorting protein [Bacteroidota bacterium]
MKTLNPLFLLLLVFLVPFTTKAQDVTVDEILEGYFENTGGKEAWMELEGVKTIAKVNQGGVEIPLEIVRLKDGRQYTKFSFQGTDFYQGVYDGQTLWSINFQSMQAEKSDQETTDNFKLESNDFPDPFLNYAEKGYTVELVGTETFDGAETYKVKLTKEPQTIDGKEVEDVSYYYFDAESFVPLAQEVTINQGPQAGQIALVKMSDYDEVDGLYFPFSMSRGVKDGPSQPIIIESIELNPEIEEGVFAFPEK